ncbi:hypothetical protein J6590_017623, partial [Homalodisca vitripennis]
MLSVATETKTWQHADSKLIVSCYCVVSMFRSDIVLGSVQSEQGTLPPSSSRILS